jgi:hypothetical protein
MERLEDVLKFNPPLRAKKKVIIKIIKQNSNKEKKRKQCCKFSWIGSK